MLKNRICYIAALLGIFLFYCFYTGWISWFLLWFSILLPIFSLLCSLPSILTQNVTADFPTSCLRGEYVALPIYNHRKTFFPTPLCRVQICCEDHLGAAVWYQNYEFCAWKKEEIVLNTEHCGAYTYSFSKGHITDYLGLFTFRLRLPELGTLRVQPHQTPPEPLPNLSRFQSQVYRPKYGGGFSELHDLREYRPGDNLRISIGNSLQRQTN